jgi:hypothetical protein
MRGSCLADVLPADATVCGRYPTGERTGNRFLWLEVQVFLPLFGPAGAALTGSPAGEVCL